MDEEAPHLRIVGPEESRRRRRRPGAAVVLILLYALIFGAALWYLAARSNVWRKVRHEGTDTRVGPLAPRPPVSTPPRSGLRGGDGTDARDALLAGEGLPEPARSRYFSRLATERCDCGCGRTLSDCLANEKSCSRSPALAEKLRKTENGKR
jgi:hypothetical protein